MKTLVPERAAQTINCFQTSRVQANGASASRLTPLASLGYDGSVQAVWAV